MKMEERLRKARRYIGLTQCQISDELGISQSTYSQFENGVYPFRKKYAETLRMKFGINPDWIMTGSGEIMLGTNLSKVTSKLSKLNDEQLGDVERYIDYLMSR